MAVEKQLLDTNPELSTGLTTKQDVGVVTRADLNDLIPQAFDICKYEPEYIEMAFSETGGINNDDYKNDKTDLLFGLSLTTDTILLKLFKVEGNKNVEKATITDNTYGTYFDNTAFPDQLKIGFLADWNLIQNAFSVGIYFFQFTRTIIGVTGDPQNSHKFNLAIYDDQRADSTIRVRTKQFGFIEGGFNYDLEWIGHVRLNGKFDFIDYEDIIENYISSGRKVIPNQEKVKFIYAMNLTLHPGSVLFPLIKDRLLGSDIFITPYGLFNVIEVHREINVSKEGKEEVKTYEMNTNARFTINFTDKVQVPIKRNFS